jgi:hypothetical protein
LVSWFDLIATSRTRRRKAFILSVLADLTLAVGQWGPTGPTTPPPPSMEKDYSRDFPSLQKL